jgi:hypothetical protein
MTTTTTDNGTTSTVESGLRGTLSPEEYTTKTMPHWGQSYLSPVAKYGNMDYVSVVFATDAEKAAALIPKELELLGIPGLPGQVAANLVFAKYRECDLGPYMEVIVSLPVLHQGQVYGYVPAIYVDNDAALLAGRELGGYPKKLGQITVRNHGDLFLSHISRGGMQEKTDPRFSDLASASVRKSAKLFSVPLPAETTVELPPPYDQLLPLPPATGQPQDFVLRTMALRRFPGIGAGPDGAAGAAVVQLVGTPWHVTNAEVYAADDISMEFYPSKDDPINELLPSNAVLGAFILRGDMYTSADEWVLIEDLKNAEG